MDYPYQRADDILGTDTSNELALICPVCLSEWTHHVRTMEFQRKEDQDTTAVVVIEGGGVVVEGYENPSPRRDAVVLTYRCESGHHFDLELAQHKGNTFVRTVAWEE